MNASSTRRDHRRTVLIRMAKDQARAERIKDLKDSHPEITWDEIASYVGVSSRAANAWGAHGGIAPANCRRLAAFFNVDYRELYHGPQDSPDLMTALKGPARSGSQAGELTTIEAKLEELLALVEGLALNAAVQQAPEPSSGATRAAKQRGRKARAA